MKRKILIALFFISFFSCEKQMNQSGANIVFPGSIDNVKQYLNNNLSATDLASVDYSKLFVSKSINGDRWMLRLAIKDKDIAQDFLLLQTDSLGNCSSGRIVHLSKDRSVQQGTYNGIISIQQLNRQLITSSAITNGYIESFHPALISPVQINMVEANIVPGPSYDVLPEVIVVGYYSSGDGGGISYSDFLSLESFMSGGGSSSGGGGGSGSGGSSGGGNGGSSGVYNPAKPGSGGGGGTGVQPSNAININNETSPSKPGINVQSYMKCFSTIPDAGSQCSVTIFTDLPVNDNPTEIFNWNTGAVGHSFLQLTKTVGGQSVTQIIGFTATKPFQAMMSPVPVPGKIVDNAGHKYNASLTMNITPAQLNTEIEAVGALSGSSYDLVNYNCVNFSVSVINAIRPTNPLSVPELQIPGASQGLSTTPEGLYILLSNIKEAGGPEAKNIMTNATLYSGASHGACN